MERLTNRIKQANKHRDHVDMNILRTSFNNVRDIVHDLDGSLWIYTIYLIEGITNILDIMLFIYMANVRKQGVELVLLSTIVYPCVRLISHCMIHGMAQTSVQTFFRQLDKMDVTLHSMSDNNYRNYRCLKAQSVVTYIGFTISGFIHYNMSTLLAVSIYLYDINHIYTSLPIYLFHNNKYQHFKNVYAI